MASRSANVIARVTPEERAALDRLAVVAAMPVSAIVRRAIALIVEDPSKLVDTRALREAGAAVRPPPPRPRQSRRRKR